MKILRIIISLVPLNLMALAYVSAQVAVPPPPKPADDGPSLAETMQFIQEKLNGLGQVNYVVYTHDNVGGTDFISQSSAEARDVIPDPATCRIGYHWVTANGAVAWDISFSLHDVRNVTVMTGEQNQRNIDLAAEHPAWDSKISPPLFVLIARRTGNVDNSFYFTDEDMANRVAKAMVHAVELCGGGNKDLF